MPEESPSSQPSADAPQPDPWERIFRSQEHFLSTLECIQEMIELVLPALKNRDAERAKRIESIIASFKKTDSNGEFATFEVDYLEDALEFGDHVKKIRRAEQMFRQSNIIAIVSEFDQFVASVLHVLYMQKAEWLKNPNKSVSYKDILELDSLDTLKEDIIKAEIESLSRDSHETQISFLDGKLKLGIAEHFPGYQEFLEITERRNLFVHSGGVVNSQYMSNLKRWGIEKPVEASENSWLTANDKYIQDAIDCFYELCIRITQATVRRLFPECYEAADKLVINRTVELLSEERWDLAERVFVFAESIPGHMLGDASTPCYLRINRCIALKFAGKDFQSVLNQIDWTPFHPKYHFAIAVLEDRFDDALELLRSQAVQVEISESHLRSWPLLKEFRKTEGFQKVFREIYNKDFRHQLREEAKQEIGAIDDKTQQGK